MLNKNDKTFTADITSALAAGCVVKIRTGYLYEDMPFLPPMGLPAETEWVTDHSVLHTIASVADLKNAIIDGKLAAERIRIDALENTLTTFKNDFSVNGKTIYGRALRHQREFRTIPLQILLERPKRTGFQRLHIFDFHTSIPNLNGYEISKIDFETFYIAILRTDQHAKNIDALCNSIVENISEA